MKNKIMKICFLLVLSMAFAACQPVSTLPAETKQQKKEAEVEEAEETSDGVESTAPEVPEDAAPKTINISNAASLEIVLSKTVSTGAVTPIWRDDSAAFWLMDLYAVVLHDSRNGEMLARFAPGMYSAIYDASPDGNMIAYALETDDIRLYDLGSETDQVIITTGFPYSTAFFSPDGKTLAVPSMMDLKVVFFNTTTGAETGSVSGFDTAAPAYSAKFGAGGKKLLWFARGTVQPMDIASGEMGPVLSHEDFVTYREFSPDGKVIATTAAGMFDGEYTPLLTLWNAVSGDRMAQVPLPTYFTSISFSPDSKLITASSEDGIIIFNSPYGEEVARYNTSEAITDVAFSPDGTKLVTTSKWGLLQMYAPN